MAKWSDLLPDVAALLPGCPNFTIEHELRRAAIEFFERSRAWKAMLDPIHVSAGQPDIEIEPSDLNQEAVVRVESVWFGNNSLNAISADELDGSSHGDWMMHVGAPSGYVTLMSGEILLYPIPRAPGILKLRASLRPSDSATYLPDSLMTYRRAIGQGALSQLRIYSEQPWTDITLASINAAEFNAAINKLNLHAARSQGRARIASRVNWC